MDTQNFIDEVDALDKDRPYFIYCRSGNRSGQACQLLESKGFTKTYNLLGGMLEWSGELKDYTHED
jgi:rhodanese-related sulfurtransferase